MIISTQEILLIKHAISSCALENGWDKAKEEELFNQAMNYILELKNATRTTTA